MWLSLLPDLCHVIIHLFNDIDMKNLIKYGAILLLFIAASFIYDALKTVYKSSLPKNEKLTDKAEQKKDSDSENPKANNDNSVVNEIYGYSVSIPNQLRFKQKNVQNSSLIVTPTDLNKDPEEVVAVSPVNFDEPNYINEATNMGFSTNRDHDGHLVVNKTYNHVDVSITYIPSENGGGLIVAHIKKELVPAQISQTDLKEIISSIEFQTPAMSFQERVAAEQKIVQAQQKQNLQNQIDRKKRETVMLKGLYELNRAGEY